MYWININSLHKDICHFFAVSMSFTWFSSSKIMLYCWRFSKNVTSSFKLLILLIISFARVWILGVMLLLAFSTASFAITSASIIACSSAVFVCIFTRVWMSFFIDSSFSFIFGMFLLEFRNYPIFSESGGFDSRNICFLLVFWFELFQSLIIV